MALVSGVFSGGLRHRYVSLLRAARADHQGCHAGGITSRGGLLPHT